MNNTYCIYKHINLINGKIYIGQTCQKPEYRWNHGNGYKGSPRFYSAIQKYGWKNFKHEILFSNLTLEEANEIEDSLIKEYKSNSLEYGYNLDNGGKNKGTSEETRFKQSKAALNRAPVSKETKLKLSTISKGRKDSEETRNKKSIASINREANKKEQGIKRERAVKCLNTGEIFPSCRQAADWCGLVGTSGISLVCQHKKQSTAGVHPITKEKLKWKYVE